VKAKLMAFDYVLANQEHRYLATEDEKVGYFTGELGIKIDSLPTKIYSSRKTESTTDRGQVSSLLSCLLPAACGLLLLRQ